MNKLFDILPPFSDKPLPRIDVKATLKMYPPDKYKEIKQLIDLISQHEERKNKIEESEKLSFSGKMQTSGPLFPRFTTLQVGFSTPQITSPFVNTSQTWPTLTYEQATALAKKQEELEKQKAENLKLVIKNLNYQDQYFSPTSMAIDNTRVVFKTNINEIPYNKEIILQAREKMRNKKVPDIPDVDNGKPALSCINTVTGAYGKNSQVAGNRTFAKNPENYGFKEIPIETIQPGDLYQQWVRESKKIFNNYFSDKPYWGFKTPYHMVMLDSITPNGKYLFDYSNGSDNPNDSSAIKIQLPFLEIWEHGDTSLRKDKAIEYMRNNGKAYRFVGFYEK